MYETYQAPIREYVTNTGYEGAQAGQILPPSKRGLIGTVRSWPSRFSSRRALKRGSLNAPIGGSTFTGNAPIASAAPLATGPGIAGPGISPMAKKYGLEGGETHVLSRQKHAKKLPSVTRRRVPMRDRAKAKIIRRPVVTQYY